MTDIQRHLKGIRKILAAIMARPAAVDDLYVQLYRELRAFLPHSYGIGSGRIIGHNGTTAETPLLLYDVPLSNNLYAEGTNGESK